MIVFPVVFILFTHYNFQFKCATLKWNVCARAHARIHILDTKCSTFFWCLLLFVHVPSFERTLITINWMEMMEKVFSLILIGCDLEEYLCKLDYVMIISTIVSVYVCVYVSVWLKLFLLIKSWIVFHFSPYLGPSLILSIIRWLDAI